MHVRNLVFAVQRPIFSQLPARTDTVVVPLRWEVITDLEQERYPVLPLSHLLEVGDVDSLLSKALDYFKNFNLKFANEVTEYTTYISFEAVLRTLSVEWVIDSAIKITRPENLWIPAGCQQTSVLTSTDEMRRYFQFVGQLPYVALRQPSRTTPSFYFHEDQRGSSIKSSRTIPGLAIDTYHLVKRLQRKMGRAKSWSRGADSTRYWLVVGQPSKSQKLLKLLREEGVPYQYYADVPGDFHRTPQFIDRGYDAKKMLNDFLNIRQTDFLRNIAELKVFANKNWIGLITDHQYDAKTRVVLGEFAKRNVPIAVYPEGAQPIPGALSKRYDHWLWTKHGIRFVLGELEKELLSISHPVVNTLITGYLGDSDFEKKKLLRLVEGFAQLKKVLEHKTRIFVALDLYQSEFKIEEGFEYAAARQLLQHFQENSNRYDVIVKCRSSILIDELQQMYPSLKFRWRLAWQLYCQQSDVVIASNTSIAIEAVTSKKPVIIWKPFDYAMLSDVYSNPESDVLRKVAKVDSIDQAIYEVMSSQKNDFDKYEYFLAQKHDRVIDWVKEAVLGSRAA